ncbi:HIT domain-containing protein [Kribbella sp. VKM Ac-2569]|uniref:HIT domain-containing protein n=1 Tax=Kribbella sp. VKM Ac-2569 TaxID=2512220 RepID=UPI0018E5713F|nr:HIT domain-containing protein [Kribbella sp. VKM Ac-2569]
MDPDVREVYRDEHVVAFFPTEPATLGHTLVASREHIPDIWGLDEDLAAYIGRAVVRLAGAVQRAVQPEGLNIIQSNGTAATQTVFHFHVHLVPRWTEDGIGRIWPPETHFTDAQKDDAWERLREQCRRLVSHA